MLGIASRIGQLETNIIERHARVDAEQHVQTLTAQLQTVTRNPTTQAEKAGWTDWGPVMVSYIGQLDRNQMKNGVKHRVVLALLEEAKAWRLGDDFSWSLTCVRNRGQLVSCRSCWCSSSPATPRLPVCFDKGCLGLQTWTFIKGGVMCVEGVVCGAITHFTFLSIFFSM